MSNAYFFDGKKKLTLTLPPETLELLVEGTYATNHVLDTKLPLVRKSYASYKLELGRILLISPGLVTNQYPSINTLTYWAQSQTRLKFSYNTYTLPLCYISTLKVVVKQWYNNTPVHAELDISLMPASLANTAAVGVNGKLITEREQLKYKTNIRVMLKPLAKRKLLGISDGYLVEVTNMSIVQIADQGVTKEYEYDKLLAILK